MSCAASIFKENAEGDVAYIHERTKNYFNHINVRSFNDAQRRLDYTKDRVFLISLSFYFEKNSRLRARFNRCLRFYNQAGLINHWAKQYTENDKKLTGKFETKNIPQLKLQNITALLAICGCIYALSIVVFLLELLTRRFKALKSCIDFITY